MPRGYRDVDLGRDEQVVVQYPATVGQVSGLLVVTNYRLLYQTVDWRQLNRIIHVALRIIGHHTAVIGHFADAYLKYSDSRAAIIPEEEIVSFGPGGSDELFVTTADGSDITFTIAATLFTPKWSSRNEQARDAIIRAMKNFGA